MSAVLSDHLHIRPVLQEHIAEILEIERSAYEFPWTEGIFKDCLRVGYLCRVRRRLRILRVDRLSKLTTLDPAAGHG